MSAMSDFLENKILDHICATTSYTAPSAVYLGLSTGDFTDTGSGASELSGSNYSRKAVVFAAAASGATSNTSKVDFDPASGNWGSISHWGIFDAAASGNILLSGSFSSAKTIETNDVLRISSGDLDLTAA